VIPASFDYVRPDSLDAAVHAVAAAGDDGKILAGGQSLLPILRLRLSYPETVIDLGRVPELREVTDNGASITIGSMVTHAEVIAHPLIGQVAPLLVQATETVADRQVRHRGTFGGALAHADPAGDLASVALTLDAVLHVRGPNGAREIAAKDFFLDYLTTSIEPGELLTGVEIPKLGPEWGSHYEKFNRVAQAWSMVAVAALVRRSNGSIAEARIGLTNMGSVPLRAGAVETALAAVGAASQHAVEGTNAPSDLSAHADYRNHLVQVLTKRAVLSAAGI
jgi:carbon-monoxide dehydrogenase medium subunit